MIAYQCLIFCALMFIAMQMVFFDDSNFRTNTSIPHQQVVWNGSLSVSTFISGGIETVFTSLLLNLHPTALNCTAMSS